MLEKEQSEDKSLQLRINIDGKTKEMFEWFMEEYNLERYTDTFRLIVKRAYKYEHI